jgi:protein-S-isoprenylcysteine O-methyltransferase Ste14
LAVVFTVGLTFATIELPALLARLLSNVSDIHPGMEPGRVAEFMAYARPIGYTCLAVIIALILVGFLTGKRRLSFLGSFAFFLPTFGYFAASMFFLAGLGVLRTLWLPFWDTSIDLLKLGDVVYLPYMIVVYPFSLLGVDVRMSLNLVIIGLGLLIFTLGTIAWFYSRYQKKGMSDFWIYRHSRHPQYLGFLVWSYGVMLLAALEPVPFGGQNPGAGLIWLLTALIVIGIALSEERSMIDKHGESYLRYRDRTRFILPLPSFITSLATAPLRILFKRTLPQNGKQVLSTLAVYVAIFVLLSLPFALLNWPPGDWMNWPCPAGPGRPIFIT